MRRPPQFHEFIGHKRILDPVRRELEGAMALNEPLSHMPISGTSGVGKTCLARALAQERGVQLHVLMGNASRAVIVEKLLALEHCDFLFLDEAHNLRQAEQELLFEAIDSLRVPLLNEDSAKKRAGQSGELSLRHREIRPFTLVLATDRPGILFNATRKRFPLKLHLPPYSFDEMREIVATLASAKKVLLKPQATGQLARVCHGNPRRAVHLLERLCRFHYASPSINTEQLREFLNVNRIDDDGLEEVDRSYLACLKQHGRASLETLAHQLGTDPKDVEH
jgi:Holliday junction DNA helicase RuvB